MNWANIQNEPPNNNFAKPSAWMFQPIPPSLHKRPLKKSKLLISLTIQHGCKW